MGKKSTDAGAIGQEIGFFACFESHVAIKCTYLMPQPLRCSNTVLTLFTLKTNLINSGCKKFSNLKKILPPNYKGADVCMLTHMYLLNISIYYIQEYILII